MSDAPFTFLLRRGTAFQWLTANPILGDGEPGVETDTERFKIGNGVDVWSVLPYYLSEDAITTYIQEQLANNPVGPEQIDQIADLVMLDLELPDLTLLWANAKA